MEEVGPPFLDFIFNHVTGGPIGQAFVVLANLHNSQRLVAAMGELSLTY